MAELENTSPSTHKTTLFLLVGGGCMFFGGEIKFISGVNSTAKTPCHYVLTHTSFTEMAELENKSIQTQNKPLSLVLVLMGGCFF